MLGALSRALVKSSNVPLRRALHNRTNNLMQGDLTLMVLAGWIAIAIPPAWCLTHGETIAEAMAEFVGTEQIKADLIKKYGAPSE